MKYSTNKVLNAIRELFWFRDSNYETHTKALIKLANIYQWHLKNGDNVPNLVNELEQKIREISELSGQNGQLTALNYKFRDEANKLVAEAKKAHEAEIIRLKDIIQAKQVQLDKLLTDINK